MPTVIMSDNHNSLRDFIIHELLQFPPNSPQANAIIQLAPTSRRLLALIAQPEDWWSGIIGPDGTSPFTDDQLEELAALHSFNNNQQNNLYPTSVGFYDFMTANREDFERFAIGLRGTVAYNEKVAAENYRRNKELEEKIKNMRVSKGRIPRMDRSRSKDDDVPQDADDTSVDGTISSSMTNEHDARRIIKRYEDKKKNESDYLTFEEDEEYYNWAWKTDLTLTAQGMAPYLLDPEYEPEKDSGHDTNYESAQATFMSILAKKVKTEKGMEIVRDAKGSKRATKAYAAIKKYYSGSNSAKAITTTDKLFEKITHYPVNRDPAKRNESRIGSMTDWTSTVTQFNSTCDPSEQIKGNQKLTHFKRFIRQFPELNHVTTSLNSQKLTGTKFTADQEIAQYESAAILADACDPRVQSSPRSVSKLIQATNSLNINQAESIVEDTYGAYGEGTTYDIFRTSLGPLPSSIRLADEIWKQLSNEDRRAWVSMSNQGRALIVRLISGRSTVDRGDDRPSRNSSGRGEENNQNFSSQANNGDRSRPRYVQESSSHVKDSSSTPTNRRYNVQFADTGEAEEHQTGEKDESYQVNMSLIDTIQHPLPSSIESKADIAIDQNTDTKANNLLYILSQDDPNKKKSSSLSEVYGGDDDGRKEGRLSKAKSKAKMLVQGRLQCNMTRISGISGDTSNNTLLVNHVSTTLGTSNHVPNITAPQVPSLKTDKSNLGGMYPLDEPDDAAEADFVSSNDAIEPEFVSLNDKVPALVEDTLARDMNSAIAEELRVLQQRRSRIVNAFIATLLDRGCNFPVAGEPLTAINLTDQYVTVSCMGGSVNTNLRVGTFKAVILVHDPQDGMDHEVMGIFRNYACHPDPKERAKMQTIHSALHIEANGIDVRDSVRSLRRITFPNGTYLPIGFNEGLPIFLARKATIDDEGLPRYDVTSPYFWDPSRFDLIQCLPNEYPTVTYDAHGNAMYNAHHMLTPHMHQDAFPNDATMSIDLANEHKLFFTSSVLTELMEATSVAWEERTLTSYYFHIDTSNDIFDGRFTTWLLYAIRNGEFIQSVRYLEALHRLAIESAAHCGRSKFREKLNMRLNKMGHTYDLINHLTRIHDEPWTKPASLRTIPAGQEENPHTIVMHPWLVNHVKMYRLDPRDVIEGIIFGDSNRYIKSEQGKSELRTHPAGEYIISADVAPTATAPVTGYEFPAHNGQADRGALTYAAQPL